MSISPAQHRAFTNVFDPLVHTSDGLISLTELVNAKSLPLESQTLLESMLDRLTNDVSDRFRVKYVMAITLGIVSGLLQEGSLNAMGLEAHIRDLRIICREIMLVRGDTLSLPPDDVLVRCAARSPNVHI